MLTTFESPLEPRKNRRSQFEHHTLSRAAVDEGARHEVPNQSKRVDHAWQQSAIRLLYVE